MKKMVALLPVALLSSVSLFADGGAPAGGGNMMQTGIMLLVAVLFFYFILWRPEQKRRKKMQRQRENLKKGDRVTAMGIVGTIAEIKDTTLMLKMVEGAKIEVLKSAITEVQSVADEEAKKVEIPSK